MRRAMTSLAEPFVWGIVGCAVVSGLSFAVVGCTEPPHALVSKGSTFAELRTVRRGVTVKMPSEGARATYPRERLVDGEEVALEDGALAWLRRDGGATLLVRGPAALILRSDHIEVKEGRVFVDTSGQEVTDVRTPRGPLHLAAVRASLEVQKAGAVSAYVLSGGVRTDSGGSAGPGEELALTPDGKATTSPRLAWEDWTGGLATTDRAAQPAPYGVGTVGARTPGQTGEARFPLAIQKLEVRVTIDHDFAVTEVDEVFFNPSSETVEGIYSFRTPQGATLHRFAVDRDGELAWGRVKEKQQAAAQYQANVYVGSQEDPALLEWDAPGIYKARLYPIKPGATRRVVTRYGEWLSRTGPKGDRRLYTYPMAAEASEGTLPRIEELSISVDLERAAARETRAGMGAIQEGQRLVVRAYDTTPRADFSAELFDAGQPNTVAYRARHAVELDLLAADDRAAAVKDAKTEPDYVLIPLRPTATDSPVEKTAGLDLAIVVDASAATEPASLAVARAATQALLSHLGKDDRVAVWAGDATLRPVAADSDKLVAVDAARREAIGAGLARVERGGATDLGAILAEAASKLPADRRGAVVYVGDGHPTVGELAVADLRERFSRLPRPVRVFGIGVGDDADMGMLKGIVRGGFAERVGDGFSAARTALRLLEEAERPIWLGASVDLGVSIDRVYPRELGALMADETALVVGRLVDKEKPPTSITLSGSGGKITQKVITVPLVDGGDLRRRWGEGRLVQLLDEGAGRAAVVEVGTRSGVLTPFTSLYVPTSKELASERAVNLLADLESPDDDERAATAASEEAPPADNKEGGTGTRAKGEEGSMGRPASKGARYGVQGPRDNDRAPSVDALKDAQEFGMIGILSQGAPGEPAPVAAAAPMPSVTTTAVTVHNVRKAPPRDMEVEAKKSNDPSAPTAPWGRDDSAGADAPSPQLGGATTPDAAMAGDQSAVRGNMWGDSVGDSFGAGGLGLDGIGTGGGGKGEGIGLGSIGTIGHGSGAGAGQGFGFGGGHGRLGGSHVAKAPSIRMGATQVSGRLPPEVIQRIVRQQFGRFRLCYENGLRSNPNLQGSVNVRFTIDRSGGVVDVGNGGSDLEGVTTSCVVNAFRGMAFPAPEAGLVKVVYPIRFAPGDGGNEPAPGAPGFVEIAAPQPIPWPTRITVGQLSRRITFCSAASAVPLEERVGLWRERLAAAGQKTSAVAAVYQAALARCEAPTWRERTRLLTMMVSHLGNVRSRVMLWRQMFRHKVAADVLYRALLVRVKTALEIRDLHDALGLKRMDPTLLAKALDAAKAPADKVKLLVDLVAKWPDDTELSLRLLEAYEDVGDFGNGRSLARKLRRRGDATARMRTQIGEYYLRLAQQKGGTEADTLEGRRTFGEIVEFAPEDPVARRRLGDLLRAHGWYEESFRQYETLAKLVPDDSTVPLLLASAAAGMGKIEEAIRLTEKASATSAPEGASGGARTSRAMAAAFLAWARADAKKDKKVDEEARLRERARRLTSLDTDSDTGKTVRVLLTWEHPELHPTMWSNALGSPMPAADGDVLLGVAQTTMPVARPNGFVEVRLEKDDAAHAARLGLTATLTVLFDEGTDEETIVRMPVTFAGPEPTVQRFTLANRGVTPATGGAK
jgi:tetratricopeptide (TPR) repeat protein